MSTHGFTPLAPLPAVDGVERDLCVDDARHVQVEVARYPRAAAVSPAFALEARRVQEVRHPCLAAVVGVVVPDEAMPDDAALVIETHAQGPRLAVGAAIPHAAALRIGADLADALVALHGEALVHGAVGADAVVLDALGRPVLMGAATPLLRAAALGEEAPPLTADDDVRGLGAVLYGLVCGREPGDPPLAPASLAPTIPPALNGLVLSLLSRDPLRPPPPAAAVALRLREMVGDPPPGVSPAPPRRRPERPPRRERPVVVPPAALEDDGLEPVAAPPLRRAPVERRPSDVVLTGALVALVAGGLLTAFALRGDDGTSGTATTPSTQTVTSVQTQLAVIPGATTAAQPTAVPTLPPAPIVTVVGDLAQNDPLALPATTVVVTVPGPVVTVTDTTATTAATDPSAVPDPNVVPDPSATTGTTAESTATTEDAVPQ